jgi:hypothetical protein
MTDADSVRFLDFAMRHLESTCVPARHEGKARQRGAMPPRRDSIQYAKFGRTYRTS